LLAAAGGHWLIVALIVTLIVVVFIAVALIVWLVLRATRTSEPDLREDAHRVLRMIFRW
jgi:hypothetical protein